MFALYKKNQRYDLDIYRTVQSSLQYHAFKSNVYIESRPKQDVFASEQARSDLWSSPNFRNIEQYYAISFITSILKISVASGNKPIRPKVILDNIVIFHELSKYTPP